MIVAQLATDRSMSTCVGGFEIIIAQVAADRSISTCVGRFEVIAVQLATDRSMSTCVGGFEMIIAQLANEHNVSLFHLFLPFLFPSSAYRYFRFVGIKVLYSHNNPLLISINGDIILEF